ncbi:MAG: hypothetical protein WHS88_10060 [Anaerohalosphaeraceae bacterium]
MNYYGGDTALFDIRDDALAVFKGGRINGIRSFQYVGWVGRDWVGPHIEIVCRDYVATSTLVTGTWNTDNNHDGLWDTFRIQLLNQSGYSPVLSNIKFTVIPEPATVCLLVLGGLFGNRRG